MFERFKQVIPKTPEIVRDPEVLGQPGEAGAPFGLTRKMVSLTMRQVRFVLDEAERGPQEPAQLRAMAHLARHLSDELGLPISPPQAERLMQIAMGPMAMAIVARFQFVGQALDQLEHAIKHRPNDPEVGIGIECDEQAMEFRAKYVRASDRR